jgi:uroporphyrinogen III methyltransferase / synthase
MAQKGTVYLIGAGPGDCGLLTAKGLDILRQADVLLYDRLVNPLLLEETKPGAELLYAGKLPNRHILRQEAIHDEMVRHAQKGKCVVRLKGGDPSVFGRVGEEAAFLDEYGIPYEIVPGVTAGIAAPAYAGVPVTHRLHGANFAIATGHSRRDTGLPEIDWSGLASIDTVAFYMGIKHLPTIAENLITHGRPKDEKVLLIQWGTTSKQRTLIADLGTIARKAEAEQFTNPAIALIGDVAALYQGKSWFERKPLFGSFPLIANGDGSSQLASFLKEEGAETFVYPRFHEVEEEAPLIHWETATDIAFYEEKDVIVFFRWLQQRGLDIRTLSAQFSGETDSAVQALQQRGLASVQGSRPIGSDRLFLSRGGLSGKPGWKHIQTRERTVAPSTQTTINRLLDEGHLTDLVFLSRESVECFNEAFAAIGREKEIRELNVLCLSDEAKKAAISYGLSPQVKQSVLSSWMEGAYAVDFICGPR